MKDGEEDSDGRDDHLLDKSTEKMIPGMQCVKELQVGDSISLNPMEPSATESIDDNSHLSEVSSNSEAESGRTVHLSDSSLTTMSSLGEFLESSESQHPHKTESLSRTEDRMSRSLTGPSQSLLMNLLMEIVVPLMLVLFQAHLHTQDQYRVLVAFLCVQPVALPALILLFFPCN
ncbi:hypothetical protein CRYUN_Cryun07bG0033000 [Craigia yunnanensis]